MALCKDWDPGTCRYHLALGIKTCKSRHRLQAVGLKTKSLNTTADGWRCKEQFWAPTWGGQVASTLLPAWSTAGKPCEIVSDPIQTTSLAFRTQMGLGPGQLLLCWGSGQPGIERDLLTDLHLDEDRFGCRYLLAEAS